MASEARLRGWTPDELTELEKSIGTIHLIAVCRLYTCSAGGRWERRCKGWLFMHELPEPKEDEHVIFGNPELEQVSLKAGALVLTMMDLHKREKSILWEHECHKGFKLVDFQGWFLYFQSNAKRLFGLSFAEGFDGTEFQEQCMSLCKKKSGRFDQAAKRLKAKERRDAARAAELAGK